MQISVVDSLSHVPAQDWNQLSDQGNPFVRHEFLAGLERTGCVSEKSGWLPRHILLYSGHERQRQLLGAVPMYLKFHSYGEYVFDWAWANAYQRAGMEYYPKLVAAVPFTPATGPRILLHPRAASEDAHLRLIDEALNQARDSGASSLHWLFTSRSLTDRLEQRGMMRRTGHQFHWRNNGFSGFAEFLDAFSSTHRKKIKRERRRVREAGVRLEIRTGAELEARDWDQFYEFYFSTIANHGAIPYLSREFFYQLGRTMPQAIVMVFAVHDGRVVAGALNLRGEQALYGRYWGCLEDYHSLHFETCYYTPIEYCLEQGIHRFEAGAQGEHKLKRGFLPQPTYSAHWLAQPAFADAVADFLKRERQGEADYVQHLNERSPFRQAN
jgi:predicted N-acyltransferase